MNWQIFSMLGYASVAVWLCIPVLWILHRLHRRLRWLCHLALLLAILSFALAKINSNTYVSRIQIDRSSEIAAQRQRLAKARQAAIESREDDASQVRFAEDASAERLDKAGMDESELKYIRSFDDAETPEWKKQKQKRSAATDDGSLESLIGAADEKTGMAADTFIEEKPPEPIFMSDSDKAMADRLDSANLKLTRLLICVAFAIVVIDYLRRANIYEEAYCPLPLPSTWVDALTPTRPVRVLPASPCRTLPEELETFVKRGDSYVYLTDDAGAAAKLPERAYRLPCHRWPVDILSVTAAAEPIDDDFVFETLWYGRSSFVVDSSQRAEQMLARFVELLTERRATRARARQTVHVVWDIATPIPEEVRHRFATLGRETRYSLLLCREAS